MKRFSFLAACFGFLFLASTAAGSVVTLQPTSDLRILNNNTADTTTLSVYNQSGNVQRSLVQFDLTAAPPVSGIKVATFAATHNSTIYGDGNGTQPTNVSPISATWNPAQVSWNNRSTGNPWGTPGGDFGSAFATYTTNIPNNSGVRRLGFDATPQAQAWVATPASNNGLIMTGGVGNGLHMYSSSGAGANRFYRPTLYINTYAYFMLGDTGSVAGASNVPRDATGMHDFSGGAIGTPTVDTTDFAPVAGNTASMVYSGGQGSYVIDNPGVSPLPTDNFKVEIWAKTTDLAQNNIDLLAAGTLKIGINGSNWYGDLGGVLGTAAVSSDTWTKLSISVVNGISTFRVNDFLTGSSGGSGGVNLVGMHLGVEPGATGYFRGKLDELSITYVPEPSSLAMLAFGSVFLWFIKGRRGR